MLDVNESFKGRYMKVLIIGSSGLLGGNLINLLKNSNNSLGKIPEVFKDATVFAVDKDSCDITNFDSVKKCIEKYLPDLIINCAGYVDFNGCENNPDLAYKLNTLGPKYLAIISEKYGCKFVHISTDYVFDGNTSSPYSEFDNPNPLSVYGKTKKAGEDYVVHFCKKHFIIRTAWLYGPNGLDFIDKILSNIANGKPVTVVNDQIGTPTFVEDLCYEILKLSSTENYGLYHCTNNGVASWYDFAIEIKKYLHINEEIIPCKTSDYTSKNLRPLYSVLDNMALRNTLGDDMRDWKDALQDYISRLKNEFR